MPANDSLKRLGGGRWETRDGRFAIEPQSGTWVVVDNEQTDELGLPLVRGPFGSLTAAREAIDGARLAGPAESPLAGRIEEAGRARTSRPAQADQPSRSEKAASTAARGGEPEPTPKPAPAPPPEPKWLRDLAPADRRRARDLLESLERLDVDDPGALARAEIALDQPALAALAVERSLRKVMAEARTPGEAVRDAARALLQGRDRHLDVRWRLVDDRGRPIADLDLSD